MPSITFDLSGRDGLIDRPSTNRNNYVARGGQLASGIYNPFIRPGYLSPAMSSADVVSWSSPNAPVCCALYDAVNDDFYMGERGANLYKGDTMDDTALGSNAVSFTGGTIKDLEIYQVNGVKKLFTMYTDSSGDAEIGISDLPYDTSDDDLTWLSTTVSGAFSNDSTGDIFLVVADNGFAYLFMENQVHKIDGTTNGGSNGTITANSIVFPVNFRISDAIDFHGNIYMAIHEYTNDLRINNATLPAGGTKSGIYVWDRQSNEVRLTDYIPATGVQAIHKIYTTSQGTIRIICTNTKGWTVIKELSGYNLKTIKIIGYDAYPVFRDSVINFGDMIIWNDKIGRMWAHGTIDSLSNEGLFELFDYSGVVHDSNHGGILLSKPGTDSSTTPAFYFTYQSDSSTPNIIRIEYPVETSQIDSLSVNAGSVYTVSKPVPQMSVVRNVEIYTYVSATASSDTVGNVRVYFNNNSTAFKNATITRSDIARGYINLEINERNVNSVQLRFDFSGNLGSNDFCPSYAIVNYEATESRG